MAESFVGNCRDFLDLNVGKNLIFEWQHCMLSHAKRKTELLKNNETTIWLTSQIVTLLD